MGTRSAIGIYHGTKVKGIYCHWDGYLSYNGRILQEYYNSPKANELISLGNVSSLAPEIGVKHPFSQFDTDLSYEEFQQKYQDMTTFYGRDRNERGQEYKVFDSGEQFIDHFESCGCEYFYLMKDGEWFVASSQQPNFKYLDKALTETEEPV